MSDPIERLNAAHELEWSGHLTPEQERLLAGIKGGVDRARLRKIVRRHRETGFGRHKLKYLELMDYLTEVFEDAVRLGLHDCEPRRVLDIGTGPGAFAYTLGRLGHDVVATERDDDESIMWPIWRRPRGFARSSRVARQRGAIGRHGARESSLYADLAQLLGVEREMWTVQGHEPAPNLGAPFDLVCARSLYFDHPRGEDSTWDLAAWRFFISDTACQLLREDGHLFMSFPGEVAGRERLFVSLAAIGTPLANQRVLMDRAACRRFVG